MSEKRRRPTVDDVLKLKPEVQRALLMAGILKDDSEEEWNRFCSWKVISIYLEKLYEMSNGVIPYEPERKEDSNTE